MDIVFKSKVSKEVKVNFCKFDELLENISSAGFGLVVTKEDEARLNHLSKMFFIFVGNDCYKVC